MVTGFLERRAFDAVRAASEALFPKNTLGAPDHEEAAMTERTAAYLALLPPEQRRLLLLLFVLVELLVPLLVVYRPRRYSRLDAGARGDVVRRLRASSLYPARLIGDSVKAVLTMIYMSHPRVLEHVGMYSACAQPEDALVLDVRLDAFARQAGSTARNP